MRFAVTVKDARGTPITGLTPSWSFSPGHGAIDEDGAFVGNSPGRYQVTTSLGSRGADAVVTLRPRDVRRSAKVVGRLPRKAFYTSEVWVHPDGKHAYLGTTLGGDRIYAIDRARRITEEQQWSSVYLRALCGEKAFDNHRSAGKSILSLGSSP